MQEERIAQLEQFYRALHPIVREWGSVMSRDPLMMDVCSGEGVSALNIAKTFHAKSVVLSDIRNILRVSLPPNAKFEFADVCSPNFAQKYRGKMDVITCTMSLHELMNPIMALQNMLSVVPRNGLVFIVDYAEGGWAQQAKRAQSGEGVNHYLSDLQNIRMFGLDTNTGIKHFWETSVFPGIPGEASLSFRGEIYTLVYQQKAWGEYKPVPPQ